MQTGVRQAIVNVQLTIPAFIPGLTDTCEVVNSSNPVMAGCSIQTGARLTLIYVHFAVVTFETKQTVTLVLIDTVGAVSMLAGIREALIELMITERSCVSWTAVTLETTLRVPAYSMITYFIIFTLVHILGAVITGPSIDTVTPVSSPCLIKTLPMVTTGRDRTLIRLLGTELTLKTWRTPALILLDQVHAGLVGGTLDVQTVVRVILTVWSLEARQTDTGVFVARPALFLLLITSGPIKTRSPHTGIVRQFTVLTHEPTRTLAIVVVDSVHAGRVVLTRGGLALVHVLLAGVSGVAGLTQAREGVDPVHAGSIIAARFDRTVAQTLVDVVVTIPSVPSLAAGAVVRPRAVGACAVQAGGG